MSDYRITEVLPADRSTLAQVDALLQWEGIRRDRNLDCICAILDESGQVIGTGSCFGNTLRCFAVSREHQGEGLLNQIITHLIEIQCARGNLHLFLYTKAESAKFFEDLGFCEITRVENRLVFMENRPDGFERYLRGLEAAKTTGKSAAVVMNANPFTRGHQYLVEKAAAACDTLHLFIVSEDASLVPFFVRKKLVAEGVKHLPNVVLHDSGPYIISNATFPSYFLKDEAAVIDGHARLDLAVFTKIAKALNITARYVGEEPTSQVTGLYNQIMSQQLPKAGMDIVEKFPAGIHTVIGIKGVYLSGGERQRISIARAFLKDAPIILLDEATASLDVENETAIQEALSRLIKNKTVLIIAHRMRTVAGVDQVVVLSGGIVAEQGSPAELYARKGLYAHMVDLQSASQNWTI